MPECGSIAGKHWRIAALGTALATMLLLSIGAPFAADEGAGTAPKYPPYPEVWGYTLPVPGDGSQFVRESPYQAGNGAVFYRVYTKPRLGDAEPTYRILDFFARRLREIGKQADLRFRTGGEYSIGCAATAGVVSKIAPVIEEIAAKRRVDTSMKVSLSAIQSVVDRTMKRRSS